MNSIDDFVALIRDELSLPLTAQDVGLGLDQVPGWDSLQLLGLLTALEDATGRRISMPAALEASSLGQIYDLAMAD